MPIEGVVLQMKSMHIDAVVNFPFPTPPDRTTLSKAEKVLGHLGALGVSSSVTKGLAAAGDPSHDGQITELGRLMSLFPLSPRFSRMLVSGQQQGCLPYIISVVSALSVGDPFLHDEGLDTDQDAEVDTEGKETERAHRKAFFTTQHVTLSTSYLILSNSISPRPIRRSEISPATFFESCLSLERTSLQAVAIISAPSTSLDRRYVSLIHFFMLLINVQAMEEIHKLRAQISNIVRANFPAADAGFIPKLMPPNELQLKVLRQLLAAGFIDQVAVRKDRVEQTSSAGVKYSTSKGVPYKALGVSEDVFIHPSSVLANAAPPEYVVFSELVRTSRVWIKGVTVINPAWLPSLANGSLCTFSKPTKNAAGDLVVTPRFGNDGWELPAVKAENAIKH